MRMMRLILGLKEIRKELVCMDTLNYVKFAPEHPKMQEICNEAVRIEPRSLKFVPGHLKTLEMCEKPVEDETGVLEFVPDNLNTKEMCERDNKEGPWQLGCVPDHFKTQKLSNEAVRNRPYLILFHLRAQEMCNAIMRNNPIGFFFIPDHFKIQEMCIKAFEPDPRQLKYVPDWFMTQGQVKVWHDYGEYCNDDQAIEWSEGYKLRRKAQKAKIKEELLPIDWHPSRWWDWCMSEDEKSDGEKL